MWWQVTGQHIVEVTDKTKDCQSHSSACNSAYARQVLKASDDLPLERLWSHQDLAASSHACNVICQRILLQAPTAT
jgi:hypothetical protein